MYLLRLVRILRHIMRKPVLGVFDLVQHKPDCTASEEGQRLETSDLEKEGLYYLFSENKGTDGLCLCFCKCKKQVF